MIGIREIMQQSTRSWRNSSVSTRARWLRLDKGRRAEKKALSTQKEQIVTFHRLQVCQQPHHSLHFSLDHGSVQQHPSLKLHSSTGGLLAVVVVGWHATASSATNLDFHSISIPFSLAISLTVVVTIALHTRCPSQLPFLSELAKRLVPWPSCLRSTGLIRLARALAACHQLCCCNCKRAHGLGRRYRNLWQ
jgi:hypothetical protein